MGRKRRHPKGTHPQQGPPAASGAGGVLVEVEDKIIAEEAFELVDKAAIQVKGHVVEANATSATSVEEEGQEDSVNASALDNYDDLSPYEDDDEPKNLESDSESDSERDEERNLEPATDAMIRQDLLKVATARPEVRIFTREYGLAKKTNHFQEALDRRQSDLRHARDLANAYLEQTHNEDSRSSSDEDGIFVQGRIHRHVTKNNKIVHYHKNRVGPVMIHFAEEALWSPNEEMWMHGGNNFVPTLYRGMHKTPLASSSDSEYESSDSEDKSSHVHHAFTSLHAASTGPIQAARQSINHTHPEHMKHIFSMLRQASSGSLVPIEEETHPIEEEKHLDLSSPDNLSHAFETLRRHSMGNVFQLEAAHEDVLTRASVKVFKPSLKKKTGAQEPAFCLPFLFPCFFSSRKVKKKATATGNRRSPQVNSLKKQKKKRKKQEDIMRKKKEEDYRWEEKKISLPASMRVSKAKESKPKSRKKKSNSLKKGNHQVEKPGVEMANSLRNLGFSPFNSKQKQAKQESALNYQNS